MGGKHGFLLLLALFMGAGVALDARYFARLEEMPGRVTLAARAAYEDEARRLRSIYRLNIKLEKTPMGSTNAYLPKYQAANADEAVSWFALFGADASPEGLSRHMGETDEYYSYAAGNQLIRVYKFGNMIHYERRPGGEESGGNAPRNDARAVAAAARFMENRLLFANYEETEVSFDSGVYDVRFIGRIGNIKNYAFVTRCLVDARGGVLEMTYNYMNYERLDSTRIKSMEKAFLELPNDFAEGTEITLNRCGLVYVYENSIVQPAYLFEGSYASGDTFQCFIKASLFE